MPRRGLSKPEAAKYVGVGVTKFEDLVASKRMPSPRLADTKLIWDVRELDDFFDRLPVKGGNQRNVWK
tara:strand:+ start:1295 stop:1498 length:204 start_codon:yes stop_codon:yes gene_type:complete